MAASSSTAPATGESEGPISINVRAPKDAKLSIDVPSGKTVLELKQLIAEKIEDCPPERQRLIYSGRVLKDNDTVASYKIKTGNTIHLVKSAAPTEPTPSAAQVPEQLAAGQQIAGNPLAPLANAMHPGLGGMNPFAQMGINQNDPNMMQNMMQSPDFQRQMQSMLSNPEVMDQIIAQSPELRALGPQARQIMQSPMFREMLTNPQAIQMAMQATGRGGMPGMPGAGGGGPQPGLFGLAQQQQQQGGAAPTAGAAPGAGGGMPDFSALFGAGSPFGQMPQAGAGTTPGSPPTGDAPNQQQQLQNLMNMFGGGGPGGFGLGGAGAGGFGGGFGAPAAPAAGPPPEERFQEQLAQLAGMGFTNPRQNIRALLATGGNVEYAINYMLEGGGLE